MACAVSNVIYQFFAFAFSAAQFAIHYFTKFLNQVNIFPLIVSANIISFSIFASKLENELGKALQSGVFGADMKVLLLNDGPVTIIIDSKNKN